MIILKWILEKYGVRVWTKFILLGKRTTRALVNVVMNLWDP
jgi:hypothetical protein